MPDLERPPTYSSIDPRQSKPTTSIETTTQEPQDRIFTLHRAQDHARSSGIHIKQNDNTLYYVGHYNGPTQSSDIILYAGYDSLGPWLAQLRFEQYSKDFKVYIGDLKTPAKDDWDVVRCAAGGGIFSDSAFRFECRCGSKKSRLYWTRTRDSKLGASRWSPRDFRLVDEESAAVVAAYVEKHLGEGAVKGSVRFLQEVEPKVEVMGLMVLLGLLDKTRRYMMSVARAFPNTNGY
ncbi:hypothetical protein M409DRAFT_29223 [Zasmidium cellare ATCC 36951]|uniref:Uncharacterized protein n=1 Tax=Zasmidium cellare ATCC 36951 TaxID=1080233 RepID=A0A6A6C079_ZASCE|nr:uncharacterized protein M409DRAFT_29223 [Zasmidium cellare ATCC 36951]KAF2160375.1 hypothetical protein M409DRAFT_29223 [Zasmidium cellare ATCC 36951]